MPPCRCNDEESSCDSSSETSCTDSSSCETSCTCSVDEPDLCLFINVRCSGSKSTKLDHNCFIKASGTQTLREVFSAAKKRFPSGDISKYDLCSGKRVSVVYKGGSCWESLDTPCAFIAKYSPSLLIFCVTKSRDSSRDDEMCKKYPICVRTQVSYKKCTMITPYHKIQIRGKKTVCHVFQELQKIDKELCNFKALYIFQEKEDGYVQFSNEDCVADLVQCSDKNKFTFQLEENKDCRSDCVCPKEPCKIQPRGWVHGICKFI